MPAGTNPQGLLSQLLRAQCNCLDRAVVGILNHTDPPDYKKALEILDAVADLQIQNELTKYRAKEYWCDALFCYIALGVVHRVLLKLMLSRT